MRDGGWGKEITLIFQKHVIRYVIIDAKKKKKRQQTASVKVKTDFCQGK